MTPGEQRLIEELFNRLSSQDVQDKDRSADALIQRLLRSNPDAGYLLVQTALVYEQQIAANEERIQDLESRLAEAGGGQQRGSFLGGRVPQGSRFGQPDNAGARAGSAVGTGRSSADMEPPAASPWDRAPPVAERRPGGGGFLQSALATAAGVASGLMIGDGIRGLFGGSAHAGGSPNDNAGALANADRTQDEMQDELLQREAELKQSDADADAEQDADFGSDGDDGSMDV